MKTTTQLYKADLHLHTCYSDGIETPTQIVQNAAMMGLEVIAIADHDTVKGYYEAKKEADVWGIEVIPAIEFTSHKYHILGYEIDVESPILNKTIKESTRRQNATTEKRANILKEYGVPISMEKITYHFPNKRLGKGNIYRVMIKDKECNEYLRKHNPNFFNKGINTQKEVLKFYLKKGGVAGIKSKNGLDEKTIINTIHAAGGKAVIAHPFIDMKSPKDLDELIELGLDGMEIQPNYGDRNNEYFEYIKDKGLLITFGSDYHGCYMGKPMLRESYIEKFWEEKN